MKYHYVAIEREYGSGGTEIGKRLGEISQVPCYGIEILERVSENLNVDIAKIEQYEEKPTNSFLYSIYLMGQANDGGEEHLSNESRIHLEEQRVIQEIASQGPAIFVGRCAADALGYGSNTLRVFVRADLEWRKKRAIESYGITADKADGVIHKFDRKRRNYFSATTGNKWGDPSNYHIVLDSGKLGIGQCAKLIRAAMDE